MPDQVRHDKENFKLSGLSEEHLKMPSLKKKPVIWLVGLLSFASLFLLFGLGEAQLIDWDENIYAEASRQMFLSGDYLNVYINGHLFSEKPPFFFWEQVLSYHVFGINEFAARFPSSVAAFFMILLCFFIGKVIDSYRTGLVWGVVYLTALLPSSLARAAVIDHTFNLLITSAIFFLYLFDFKLRKNIEQKQLDQGTDSSSTYRLYLTLASLCMGIAVLTKGPLGGVIPLVGFTAYKSWYRFPRIRILHFLYCAFLSLSIGLSWYLINGLINDATFIQGFIRFQWALFSKTLEGHDGPFYYHLVVVFFGLIPWTPFLFSFKANSIFRENAHFRPLFIIGASWIIFVLILMSIVSTKLPHYSASVYVPLTLFVAMVINRNMKNLCPFSWRIVFLYVIMVGGLAVLMMFIPKIGVSYLKQLGIDFKFVWSEAIYYAGAVFLILVLLAAALFRSKWTKYAVLVTALAMFVFTQNLWRYYIPPFLSYIQQPILDMVEESREQGGKVVFYRLVSFAALFYGKKPIEMLHTYKFPGNPEILARRQDQDLYIITDRSNNERLLQEHPLLKHLKDKGTFSLFILQKRL